MKYQLDISMGVLAINRSSQTPKENILIVMTHKTPFPHHQFNHISDSLSLSECTRWQIKTSPFIDCNWHLHPIAGISPSSIVGALICGVSTRLRGGALGFHSILTQADTVTGEQVGEKRTSHSQTESAIKGSLSKSPIMAETFL